MGSEYNCELSIRKNNRELQVGRATIRIIKVSEKPFGEVLGTGTLTVFPNRGNQARGTIQIKAGVSLKNAYASGDLNRVQFSGIIYLGMSDFDGRDFRISGLHFQNSSEVYELQCLSKF